MKTAQRGFPIFLSALITVSLVGLPLAPAFALGELPIIPPADTTPPVISGVAVASISSLAATIIWTTDELSVSTFQYGATTSYGTSATLGASAAIGGTAVLTNLQPSTAYYYCITATDASGNASQSCGHTFTTAAAPDTTPPVISAIVVSSIATSSADLTWTTGESATGQVEYGTTSSYGSSSPTDNTLALTHAISLAGLSPNTIYHYRVSSTDAAGNTATSNDATFTAASIVSVTVSDTTPPVISIALSISLGVHTATIAWETDELATSTLEYGTTTNYGTSATLDVSALLAHDAVLTGLTANTTYHYCIHATDLSGNASHSCNHTFTTDAAPVVADTTPPDISLVTVTNAATSSVTVNWTTDEVANGEVEYGTTAGYGETTGLTTALSLTHGMTLAGLAPNTTYHYRIRSSDEVGNTAVTNDNTFTTEMLPALPSQGTQNSASSSSSLGVTPAMISGIETASIASSSATIAWTTDILSDSQVEYGDSELFGSLTSLDSTLTTSHSATIAGLTPNTNYIFRVKSKPLGAALETASANREFTTLAHATAIVPPANISSVVASSVSSTSALVTWTTDKLATSEVQYGISTSYGQSSGAMGTPASSHSVALADLQPGTTYHFRVKSVDSVENITASEDYTFTTSAAVQTSGATGASPPSGPPAGLTLAIGGYDSSSVELTWHVTSTNADAAAEYDVRFSTYPIIEYSFQDATPAQFTSIGYGDLAAQGTERRYVVAGLNPNILYYFAVRSKFENTVYSGISNVLSQTTSKSSSVNNESLAPNGGTGGSTGGAVPTPQQNSEHVGSIAEYGAGSGGSAGASFEPTLIKAEPADKEIIFSWTNPHESNFVRTIIVKKDLGYPMNPSDGHVIYEGRGETFTDTNVQNGITSYYAVYSYNHEKIYSSPIQVSLAPRAGNQETKFNESGSLASATPILHFIENFKKGDNDIEVEHLQQILSADGEAYPEKYVTGYFGGLTEAALKRFQAKHGLVQTGIVDEPTRKELNLASRSETRLAIPTELSVFQTDLRYGDQGEAVKHLQEYLIYEGSYAEALLTGFFGNYTKNAVGIFQKKYGITPVSGYVGYKTRHKMQQLVGL